MHVEYVSDINLNVKNKDGYLLSKERGGRKGWCSSQAELHMNKYGDKTGLLFEICAHSSGKKDALFQFGFFRKQTLRQGFESKRFTWEMVGRLVKMCGYDTHV